MNKIHLPVLVFFLSFSFSGLNGQISSVSFNYRLDEHAGFRVTFESYYNSTDGSLVYFTAGDTSTYEFEWDFGDGGTSNLPALLHHYAAPGTYLVSLTVTAPGGVVYTDSRYVEVGEIEELQVPNVFAPEGNINTFIVRSDGITPLTITIMDRSGGIVYRHTSPVINWDGRTPGGNLVRPGVYYYVITSDEPRYNKNGFFHVFYNR